MTTISASVRLNDCYIKDIRQFASRVKFMKLTNNQDIDREIDKQSREWARFLIFYYNLQYCKIIIKTHAKNNIFEAIKRIQEPIDLSNEINFYKQMAFPYIVDIIYTKIKNEYNYTMIPPIIISEHMECSICLSIIDNTRLISKTKCNHYFHHNCLTKWKTMRRCPTCPNCRVAI
jgi:hypothetical protein